MNPHCNSLNRIASVEVVAPHKRDPQGIPSVAPGGLVESKMPVTQNFLKVSSPPTNYPPTYTATFLQKLQSSRAAMMLRAMDYV